MPAFSLKLSVKMDVGYHLGYLFCYSHCCPFQPYQPNQDRLQVLSRLCLCYSQHQSRWLRLLFRLCLTVGTLLNPLPCLYTLFLVTSVMVIHLMITVSTENIIEATWKHVKVSICACNCTVHYITAWKNT